MKKHVLLVEDEPHIVESLRFLLSRAGFDVSVCENGQAALDTALDAQPNVVVLDVMLPELDGMEVLRRLRADAKGQHLPVLMLTARGQKRDREQALEAGADMFITKPFANTELVSAVQTLASRDRVME